MTARAYVQDDFIALRGGVLIHLVKDLASGRVAVAEFDAVTMRDHDPATEIDAQPLRLPADMARALYEALARHYGGAPDMTTLRRDYDAERARVDRLIGHFVQKETP